jgi:hypothetical protein
MDIFRGDEVLRAGLTLHQGRLWLQEPHLVLADVTTAHSGVLHDLMLRDFLADRTIILSQQAADIPPQCATYRRIIYTLSEAGIARLSDALQEHVRAILCPTVPPTAPCSSPLLLGSESA